MSKFNYVKTVFCLFSRYLMQHKKLNYDQVFQQIVKSSGLLGKDGRPSSCRRKLRTLEKLQRICNVFQLLFLRG